MKKAQGISINVIIIAAIALAVLVVLFAIFTGRIGGFSKGVSETDTCAQKCSALNMQKLGDIGPGECSGTPIGGKYSDTPTNGCCCG
ncbi:MAG: hypothetical protein AABX00_03940 [Nanoarchaeota archaeon]